jgi:HEAT repeat protein
VVQDEKLAKVHEAVSAEPAARLRLFRLVMARPRGASLTLLRRFMEDPDETIQRMAVREIVRRKPADHNTVLLGVMKTAAYSTVRRVAGRAISAGAFENFYERFEKLDPPTRQRAGKAVFKLLPDAALRLSRRLRTGPAEQRIRAVSIAQELGVVDEVREEVLTLASHENPKVRSKAVGAMGNLKEPAPDVLLDKALGDPDPRVRANAIEVLEATRRDDYLPMIAARVRSAHNRERANAIKALHTLKVEAAIPQLVLMMRDPRPEHRISALWAARHVGVYRLLAEVVRVAREESDPKVKRYAVASVRVAAEKVTGSSAKKVEPVVFPKAAADGRKAG